MAHRAQKFGGGGVKAALTAVASLLPDFRTLREPHKPDSHGSMSQPGVEHSCSRDAFQNIYISSGDGWAMWPLKAKGFAAKSWYSHIRKHKN